MFTGPNTPRDNLVLQLDVAKESSLPGAISQGGVGTQDHGISEWYCFENGSVTYSAIYPHTIIYEVDSLGNKSEIVPLTNTPQRGTFTITTGNKYYGTRPIHLMCMNANHRIVPLSLKGSYFGHYSNRYDATTLNIYCPEGTGTVYYYENVVGGVTGTETSSQVINAGEQITIICLLDVPMFLFSTVDIIVSAVESQGGDAVIIPPASTDVYKRRNATSLTINNTVPTTKTTYYDNDITPGFAIEIADGAGGDASHGLGLEYLSNNYSFGERLSDYQIVAPYPNTQIRVLYYENGWQLAETHQLNGTQSAPDSAFREGNTGFGLAGDTLLDSGAAASLISNATNLWRWESNQPFALIINDSSSDEEILLGWMSNKVKRGIINNLSDSTKQIKIGGNPKILANNSGIIEFDGICDYLYGSAILSGETDYTIITTFKIRNISSKENWLFSQFSGADAGRLVFDVYVNGKIRHFLGGSAIYSTQIIQENVWYQAATTRDSLGNTKIYINGIPDGSGTINTDTPTNINYEVGGSTALTDRWFDGYIAQTQVFKKVLSDGEIKRFFNAFRSRFNL